MAETILAKYKDTYDYTSASLNTKNITFLSGTQTNLNKYFLDSGDAKAGGATEGAFYLTSDTHRLYIGRSIQVDGSTKTVPIPVNEGISTVTSVSALSSVAAHAGEFYYALNDNVLCIYNGTTWVQINPDTNTNDNDIVEVTENIISKGVIVNGTYEKATGSYNSGTTYYTCNGSAFNSVASSSSDDFNTYYIKSSNNGNTLIYTLTTKQVQTAIDNAQTSLNDVITYIVIPISDIVTLLTSNVDTIGLERSATRSNSSIISTTGELADATKNVTLKGGNGITISTPEDKTITISGKTYSIEVGNITLTQGDIVLTDENNAPTTATIKTGTNLGIDTSETTAIKLVHTGPSSATTAYRLTADQTAVSGKTYYTNASGTAVSPAPAVGTNISSQGYYEAFTYYGDNPSSIGEGQVLHIPKFQKDVNGHIKTIEDVGVTLPTAPQIAAVAATDEGKIILTKSGNTSISSGVDLFYKITVDGTEKTVVNQNSLGTFYSSSKVDTLISNALKNFNAMTYKGTVGNSSSTVGSSTLPSSNVSVGDTYLVNAAGNITTGTNVTVASRVGDLFIATGTENETTGYISGTITWTRVEAGDIDTRYSLTSSGNAVYLQEQGTNVQSSNGFELKSGEKINVSPTQTQDKFDFTFNHATSGVVSGTATSKTVGTNSTTSLSSSGTFIIPTITVDKYGHITSTSDTTLTLPASNNYIYDLSNNSTTTITLEQDNASVGAVTFNGDTTGGVSVTATADNIHINHTKLTSAQLTAVTTPVNTSSSIADATNSFTAITGATVDSYGHVTGLNTTTFTLPHRYTFNGSSVSTSGSAKTITNTLFQNNISRGSVSYTTNTLALSASTSGDNTTYTVDLQWGSF